MTDHKFTDAEIVKALECCVKNDSCKECPINPNYGNYEYCTNLVLTHALDIINRQKAEIEKLQTVNADMNESLRLAAEANKDMQAEIEELEKIKQNSLEIISMGEKQILEVGAKYIKEFAEKVKPMFEKIVEIMFDGNEPTCQVENCHKPDSIACNSRICVDENKEYWNTQVDNLVKEMTEGVE